MQEDLWPPCSQHLYFNPSESSVKDFFLHPVLFSHFPFLVGLSLSSLPSLPPVCFPSLPISHSLSLLHAFFLFYSPSPSHSLLCGSLRVCRAASSSQLRWISYHGNQTQISNNGMLIMVITVWRLFQENERCYFSLEGLKKENVRGEAVWTT